MEVASQTPLDVVTAFVLEKDVERAVRHLADDVRFTSPLMSIHGRAEYRALLEKFLSAHVETRIIERFARDRSACTISELVVRAPDGKPLTIPMAEWFTLRNELIVEHRVFYDPREFGRAFGFP